MNIILVSTPAGKTSFIESMKKTLSCRDVQSGIVVELSPSTSITIKTMSVAMAKLGSAAKGPLAEADAVIYAGDQVQAMHKNVFELEYLQGLNAAEMLKNLHQVLADHRPAMKAASSHNYR